MCLCPRGCVPGLLRQGAVELDGQPSHQGKALPSLYDQQVLQDAPHIGLQPHQGLPAQINRLDCCGHQVVIPLRRAVRDIKRELRSESCVCTPIAPLARLSEPTLLAVGLLSWSSPVPIRRLGAFARAAAMQGACLAHGLTLTEREPPTSRHAPPRSRSFAAARGSTATAGSRWCASEVSLGPDRWWVSGCHPSETAHRGLAEERGARGVSGGRRARSRGCARTRSARRRPCSSAASAGRSSWRRSRPRASWAGKPPRGPPRRRRRPGRRQRPARRGASEHSSRRRRVPLRVWLKCRHSGLLGICSTASRPLLHSHTFVWEAPSPVFNTMSHAVQFGVACRSTLKTPPEVCTAW